MIVKDFLFVSSQIPFEHKQHIRTAYNDEDELKELLSYIVHVFAKDQNDEHRYSVTFAVRTEAMELKSVTVTQLLQHSFNIGSVLVQVSVDVPESEQTLSHYELPSLCTIAKSYDKYFVKQLVSANTNASSHEIIHARNTLYISRTEQGGVKFQPTKSLKVAKPVVETKSKTQETKDDEKFVVYDKSKVLDYVNSLEQPDWKDINFTHYTIDQDFNMHPKSTWSSSEPQSLFNNLNTKIPIVLENFLFVQKSEHYSYWYCKNIACVLRLDKDLCLVSILPLLRVPAGEVFSRQVSSWLYSDLRGNAYMKFDNVLFRIQTLNYVDVKPNLSANNISLSVRNQHLVISEIVQLPNGQTELKQMYETPLQFIRDFTT